MKKAYFSFTPLLISSIVLFTILYTAILPYRNLDDLAVLRFFTTATHTSLEATHSAALAQVTDPADIPLLNLRFQTNAIYPLVSLLSQIVHSVPTIASYSFLGTLLTLILLHIGALWILLYLRHRYTSDNTPLIDLGLAFTFLDRFLSIFDWYRFFPFGNAQMGWHELYPRGIILTLLFGYLYVLFSHAPKNIKIGIALLTFTISLLLNAPFALYAYILILGAYYCATHLSNRQLLLLPLLFAVLGFVLFSVYGIAFIFVKRVAAWALFSAMLLYAARSHLASVPVRMFAVLASFSLTLYNYNFFIPDATIYALAQLPFRSLGITQLFFGITIATIIPQKYRNYCIAFFGILLVLATTYCLFHISQTRLFEQMPLYLTEPYFKDATEFFLFHSRP